MLVASKTFWALASVVCSVGIAACYFLFDNNITIENDSYSIVTKSDELAKQVEATNSKVSSPDADQAGEPQDIPKLKDYDDEWCLSTDLTLEAQGLADQEYQAWIESRNHVVGDRASQVESFKGYSEKVLVELGEQGNLIALAAIVDLDSSSDELKNWAARQAAIYGGTGDAVAYFSIESKGLFKALMHSGNREEAKTALLESLAWDEFMALRGDVSLLENIAFILSFEGMDELEIHEEDDEWISQRAQEIYRELSEERSKLGLSPFDNSVPKVIEVENAKNVAFALAQYESSHQWISKYYPSSECSELGLAGAKHQ
jgi:hypothetical protein